MPEPLKRRVSGLFDTCEKCGYDRGFHYSVTSPQPGAEPWLPRRARVLLICPNCAQRYDVGISTEVT
jgi:hypothetical protein